MTFDKQTDKQQTLRAWKNLNLFVKSAEMKLIDYSLQIP